MIETERLTAFLKKIHLFHGLSDEQLETVASQFKDESQKAGKVVFEEGMQDDTFYLIFSGRAVVFRKQKTRGSEQIEQPLAILGRGGLLRRRSPADQSKTQCLCPRSGRRDSFEPAARKVHRALEENPSTETKLRDLGGKPQTVAPIAIQVGAPRRGHLFSGAQAHHPFL